MKARILDAVTGVSSMVDGPRSYEWAEGNWACDCNRNHWSAWIGAPVGPCHGAKRFLVIEAVMDSPDDYKYTLEELNSDYPQELKARFLPNTSNP